MKDKIISKDRAVIAFSLFTAFMVTFLLATYFNYTSGVGINPNGKSLEDKFYLSGPDPYYNMRLIEKTIETGRYPYLGGMYGGLDPLLNYPLGGSGGRPPLFNMITIAVAKVLSIFMSMEDAIGYAMQFLPSLYGALLVIPVYFIGKTLFNRKAGLIAAFIVPLIPIHISSGHGCSYSLYDHDSFILLLTSTTIMFLMMSLKEENKKKGLLFAILAGVFVGAISLTWVAGRYIYALIAVYAIVQMIINMVRLDYDSRIAKYPSISLVTGYLLATPLYFIKHGLKPALSFYIVLAVLAFAAVYVVILKKNIPWVISIPIIACIIAGGLTFLYYVKDSTNPALAPLASIGKVIFGGVYHSKVSKTIAEATTFGISRTFMSFGPALYLISWFGFIYLILWKRLLKKWEPFVVLLTVWFLLEVYLSASAGRFLNDLVPLIAILSGSVVEFVLSKADYERMIRGIKSTGGFRGIKKHLKPFHVFGILFVTFLIVLPNAFLSLDAAVPVTEKAKIFGKDYRAGFGLSLHTERYWADAFKWIREQTKHIKDETKRPAFIAWWDYGFYCVAVAKVPTVADNFQEGIPAAGNFLTAQSEQEATAVFIVRLVQGDMKKNHGKVSEGVKKIFEKYLGNNSTALIEIFEDPKGHKNSSYGKIVSEEYGGKVYRVREENALYHDATKFLVEHLDDENLTMLYRDIQIETGKCIRYCGVEGYDMNIFNVFTFLADKGSFGYETYEDDFFKYYLISEKTGKKYTPDEFRELTKGKTRAEIMEEYGRMRTYIEKKDSFFNSMAYRIYVGPVDKNIYMNYSSSGYFYGLLRLNNIYFPTYGLKHFVAEYISPVTKEKPLIFARGSECYGMPAVVIAKYYEGAVLNGSILCNGRPLRAAVAVEKETCGTRVKIKHDMVFTDQNGRFRLLAPAGNITLVIYLISNGKEKVIKEITFNATNGSFAPISEEEATRRPGVDYIRNITIEVNASSIEGHVFEDVNSNGSYDPDIDKPLPKEEVKLRNLITGNLFFIKTNESGYYNFSNLLPGLYELTVTENGIEIYKNDSLFLAPGGNYLDIRRPKTSTIKGIVYFDKNDNLSYDLGEEISEAKVELIYSKTKKVVAEGITDENGSYLFSNILPGDYSLNVTFINETTGMPMYVASESIKVEENKTIERNISLELAEVKVSGYTLFDGEPMGDVFINFIPADIENNTAEPASATSNETTGYYEVMLKPGIYNVTAFKEEMVNETNQTIRYRYRGQLEVPMGSKPIEFNIVLAREE